MHQLPKSATAITPGVIGVGVGVVAYPLIWLVDTYVVDIAVNTNLTSGPTPSLPVLLAMLVWPICLVAAALWVVMIGLVRVFGPGKPSAYANYHGHSDHVSYASPTPVNYDVRHPRPKLPDPWGRR